MSVTRTLALIISVVLLATTQVVLAETPLERAQKIKEWRANCNDPDPDLRVAYLEGAIATNDQTVVRTCVKQALASDNDDVRNLAIRAGLASAQKLALQFSHSEAYKKALERAGTNSEQLKKLNREFREAWSLKQTNGVVSLSPIEVEIGSQTSRWYALGTSAQKLEGYTCELALVGDKLTGTGILKFGNNRAGFTLSLTLGNDGVMTGKGTLVDDTTLPVTLKLY